MKDDIQIELAQNIEKAAAEMGYKVPVMEQDLESSEVGGTEAASDPIALEEDVSATDIRYDIQAIRQALTMASLGDIRWIAKAGDSVDKLERHFDSLVRNRENVSLA